MDTSLHAFAKRRIDEATPMITPPRKLGNPSRILCTIFITALILQSNPGTTVRAQAPALTVDQLVRMSGPELDALYRQGAVAGMPPGRVRGTALLAPGTRRNGAMARGTRLVWQGKVFEPVESSAVNRFFGLPLIRAQVFQDQSWLDGAPALVLDYSQTSRFYAQYRDEIRQVAPGLLLGLMYARTTPQPTLRMYFALEAQP
jgi:hypothetical protein